MQTETITYIILSGIIALLLALFQYFYKSKKRSFIYGFLSFLRFVSIFSILLLLINPKFDSTSFFNEKPNLVVAIDNSESISYLKQDKKADSLINSIRSNSELNDQFNISYFTFGNSVNVLDSVVPGFTEKQSNIAELFQNLAEVYKNSVAPIVLVSDGNQTYGREYEFISSTYKQPVFPVILGDTTVYSDLKIEQLNVNRYTYLKNRFPVEVFTSYNGNNAVNTELNIYSGNTKVFSKSLSFNASNTSQIVQLDLPSNRVGVKTYRAELVPMDNEKNTINNIQNFAVEVIDQKTNVAIVSDVIHPDLGALKKAIESNEQRTAKILSTNEFLNGSEDFQLVICYQPTNNFRALFNALDDRKINKWVITGLNTNWSLLNQLQNSYKQQVTYQEENYQPVLNQNYNTFIIDNLKFEDFPPLQSDFGEISFSIPVETLLFKSVNGTAIDETLLATFEINEKREALLLGEGIWRWRAQNYLDNDSFDSFDNFIGKLVQYLSSNQRRSRLNLNYESFYNGNDNVKITAQYFNKNYEFDSDSNLNITLTNIENGSERTFPFVLKNAYFEVDLSGLISGSYEFTVSAVGKNVSRSGELKILDYNVEQQFLNANVTKMQNLATNSAGKSYFVDESSAIFSDLLTDSRFATIQKSSKKVVPLIDWKYLLVIIALSLASEWFTRKYYGLI